MFLPCTLALYGAASLTRSIRVKNAVLLFCSVCFYGYGGLNYLGLLAVSVVEKSQCQTPDDILAGDWLEPGSSDCI